MKIAIATQNNDFCKSLIALYLQESEVRPSLIIFEETGFSGYFKQIRARYRRYGVLKTIDMCLYYAFMALRPKKEFMHEAYKNDHIPTISTKSLNTREISQRLLRDETDLVILISTGLVDESFMASCKSGAVNIHPGINPLYRGAGGNFWALYYSDWENVGVTVHSVERKIDAGSIYYQERISVPIGSSLEDIQYTSYCAGIKGICRLLNHNQLRLLDIKKTGKDQLFGYYGLTKYLKVIRNLKKRQ